MSSVDISALGQLQSAEPLDLDLYADAKEGSEIPKAGRYTVQAPSSFQSDAFGATQAGFLRATLNPTVVGPTNEGFLIRFTRVSAKPFERGGQTVSQLGDYLRAVGLKGKLPGTPQEQANAIASTAGLTYQVDLDWEAYNKNNGKVIKGMKSFPVRADGTHQPWIEDTDDLIEDENGNKAPRRLRANVVVKRFVPAI